MTDTTTRVSLPPEEFHELVEIFLERAALADDSDTGARLMLSRDEWLLLAAWEAARSVAGVTHKDRD